MSQTLTILNRDGSRREVDTEGLRDLYLFGGTLPPGTALPEGLRWLDLGGGKLPAGTALPSGLEGLSLGGGTLPPGTVLPEGLGRLYLGGSSLPSGFAFPDSLIDLHLGGAAFPPDTKLPKFLHWLDLGGGTLPPGTEIPATVEELSLGGGTLPFGTKLPDRLKVLNFGGGTLPQGTRIPDGCRLETIGPKGTHRGLTDKEKADIAAGVTRNMARYGHAVERVDLAGVPLGELVARAEESGSEGCYVEVARFVHGGDVKRFAFAKILEQDFLDQAAGGFSTAEAAALIADEINKAHHGSLMPPLIHSLPNYPVQMEETAKDGASLLAAEPEEEAEAEGAKI